MEAFTARSEAEALTISGQIALTDESDLQGVATTIAAATPDLVYLAGFRTDLFGPVVSALREGGYDGLIMGADGLINPEWISDLGEAAEDLYMTLPSLPPDQLESADTFRDEPHEAEARGVGTWTRDLRAGS